MNKTSQEIHGLAVCNKYYYGREVQFSLFRQHFQRTNQNRQTKKDKLYPLWSFGVGSSCRCKRAASHKINTAAAAESPVEADRYLPSFSHLVLSNSDVSSMYSTESCPPSLQIKWTAVTSALQSARVRVLFTLLSCLGELGEINRCTRQHF